MRNPSGRRIGLLLVLIALLGYAASARQEEHYALIVLLCKLILGIGLLFILSSFLCAASAEFHPAGALPVLGVRRLAQSMNAGRRISSLPSFRPAGLTVVFRPSHRRPGHQYRIAYPCIQDNFHQRHFVDSAIPRLPASDSSCEIGAAERIRGQRSLLCEFQRSDACRSAWRAGRIVALSSR